jgi:predicted amidophosphoribosyltransferase
MSFELSDVKCCDALIYEELGICSKCMDHCDTIDDVCPSPTAEEERVFNLEAMQGNR